MGVRLPKNWKVYHDGVRDHHFSGGSSSLDELKLKQYKEKLRKIDPFIKEGEDLENAISCLNYRLRRPTSFLIKFNLTSNGKFDGIMISSWLNGRCDYGKRSESEQEKIDAMQLKSLISIFDIIHEKYEEKYMRGTGKRRYINFVPYRPFFIRTKRFVYKTTIWKVLKRKFRRIVFIFRGVRVIKKKI